MQEILEVSSGHITIIRGTLVCRLILHIIIILLLIAIPVCISGVLMDMENKSICGI